MYLTKLYRYNKWLFAAILFFVIMQLLVTYKRGMVISPWYNYGMYSEKIYPQKIYEVNNSLTGPAWLYLVSPQQDDKINVTLDNYRHQAKNDSLYQQEISRLLKKAHLPVPQAKYFHASFSKHDFGKWFQQYDLISHSTLQLPVAEKHIVIPAVWNGYELKIPRGFISDSNGNFLLP